MTSLDEEQETYILTEEEEVRIIENEIISQRAHKEWKMRDKGSKEETILLKLSEIDWSGEYDKVEVLKMANSRKHYEIWQQGQRAKEREEEKLKQLELHARCTAKYIFNMMSTVSEYDYFKRLIINDCTLPLIKTICFFISKDKRFESELGFSFKKGLFIRGISGLGKTHLVECVKHNELQPITIFSMIKISKTVKDEGEFILPYNDKNIIYLDDVGTEEHVVNHYGTKINFFKEFIEMYYLFGKEFNKLIVSTNNNFSEIEEKYGFRVRSRIKDMFNIVDVKGIDLRGNNLF